MGVNLSCVDGCVTKKVLNHAQVSSAFEQMSGEGMSQSMGSNRLVDTSFKSVLHNDAVHRT